MRTDLDDLVTALYVAIDDLVAPRRRLGRPPRLSDAELVCLAVAQVLLGCPSERRWLRFARTRLAHLFPYLPGQPGYNKRLRAAAGLVARVIRLVVVHTRSWHEPVRLLDATPIPCATSRQTVQRSELAGIAGYGYCAAHSRWYWGLKLYLLTTTDGAPVNWCLASPKLGERDVAAELLADTPPELLTGTIVVGDKGFAGRAFEHAVAELGAGFVRPDRRDEPRRHGSLGKSASASRASSTPSKASSAWSSTAAARSQGSTSASHSGCSPWPRCSGSTRSLTGQAVTSPPTTIDHP